MSMRNELLKFAGLAVLAFAIGGCRIKSWESYESATTPNPPGTWKGDEYAWGGVADATGGLKPQVQYNEGARSTPTGKLDPTYDQPMKGTGLNPGDYNTTALPGHGNTNAPAFQGTPGSANATSTRSAR
jgi:hypothetical protein